MHSMNEKQEEHPPPCGKVRQLKTAKSTKTIEVMYFTCNQGRVIFIQHHIEEIQPILKGKIPFGISTQNKYNTDISVINSASFGSFRF